MNAAGLWRVLLVGILEERKATSARTRRAPSGPNRCNSSSPVPVAMAAGLFRVGGIAAVLVAACVHWTAFAGSPAVTDYRRLKSGPIKTIQPPRPERYVLGNGMVVFLVADRELPIIGAQALVRTGSRWEPADKLGLASIVGTVLRTGGTKTYSGDQLDDELDRLGASIETRIRLESGGASVSLLKEDLERGLVILADVLRNPAFPHDKIELAKIRERDSIARRNDNPGAIAFREISRVLYGRNSPYARVPEYATIEAITREDVVGFHARYFQPESVILGVWGDFDPAAIRLKIEAAFGGWPRGAKRVPEVPAVELDPVNRKGLYAINLETVSQSWVVMGQMGGRRDSPDYCALEIMNGILGGGWWASRLFCNVRSKEALAYSTDSRWSAGWDREGTFGAGGTTKSASTLKILAAIQHEIRTLIDHGVTAEELDRVKEATLNGLAFESDSTGKIVLRVMDYEYYGYPSDYLQRYEAGIRRVTREDVQRVAREYLKPDQFSILVLGRQKDFDQPLSSLGRVQEIDITIPKGK